MSSWQALARIFYRPREVFVSLRETRTWGRVLVLLFAIYFADTMIGFEVTTSSNVFIEVLPTFFFFIITLFWLSILILIDALYLWVVSATMGLESRLDQWLAVVTWSGVPGAVFVISTTVVLSASYLLLSIDVLGLESSSLLMNTIFGSRFRNPSFASFFQYRYIADFWLIALQTIAFREWSGRGTLFSCVIVTLPFCVGYVLIWWLRW